MRSSDLLEDLPASGVVFLIALPLSMGIAIASGLPPALGLITAIIGGLVVGALGGAPLQISGPSAGLTVLVLQMHQQHGVETFGVIVIAAGAAQLASGLLGFGRHFQAVSPAVIRGMLAGIGILIIVSQFHVMLDSDIPGSGMDNIATIPAVLWRTITQHNDRLHDEAAMIGVLTLVAVFSWDRFKPAKLKIVPGPLVAAMLAAALAALLSLPIRYVAVPANLASLLRLPTTASFSALLEGDVAFAAVALAFVASAETLLCASAVARMHDRGRTNYDRELTVHGIANALCGLVGALPLTGVISRSTANVQAGARTRWAAVMHALWIAAFVILLPDLLALVPTSSLAAILVYIGFKLINPAAVRSLARFGRPVLLIFAATLVGIVAVNLLKGIMFGLVLSALRLMYQMSHVHFELEKVAQPLPASERDAAPLPERWDLHMHGSATFLGLPKLQDVLDNVKAGVELHFHFDELEFIDHACLDLLTEFRRRHEAAGGKVVVEWDELLAMRQKKSVQAEIASPERRSQTGPR
ncbi:MAG: SulP family inorganic anion transporter [Myxococcales bacterium]|nr:SulP family inorganic anion transporter [Myxococcales bacterium]